MKIKNNFFLFFSLLFVFCITSCKQTFQQKEYSQADIKEEIATFSGKIIGDSITNLSDLSLNLEFGDPFVGFQNYVIPIEIDGSFSQTIPCNQMILALFRSDLLNSYICLYPNEVTILNITLNNSLKNNKIDLSVSSTTISYQDMKNIGELQYEILSDGGYHADLTEEMTATEIREKVQKQMSKIQDSIYSKSNVSEFAKEASFNYISIIYLESYIRNITRFNKIDSYSFLQNFDFNNLGYLSFDEYFKSLQNILKNPVLDIPCIEELPITQWQDSVKNKIGNIIESELFYDMLAINAYSTQLGENKVLSTIQKNNIENYFTNDSSNRNQWRERINSIGGEHYYLSREVWEILTNEFGFRDIPHYLIYDKNGKLQYSGSAMDANTLNTWIGNFL